jgi:hypothetical protein
MIGATPGLRHWPIVLSVVVLAVACGGPEGPDLPFPRGTLTIRSEGSAVELEVWIAETPEAQARGLMGVETLGADQGMVFVHEEPTTSGFWMKDTLIPLSLAVWDEEGRILAILDMEPCTADPCPIYDPGVSWTTALEVNAGFFERRGVSPGDDVSLER